GILLRNGETLECLSRLKKIFFDKTGTLTSGNLMFKQLVMHPAIKKSRSDLEQKIVSLAAHSSHPIAACILNALPFKKQSPQNVSHFTTHPGLGVEGRVGNRDNQTLYLGSKLFMSIKHQVMDSYFQKLISEAESRGETTVLVGIESKVVAMLTFHEELRPEAESTISQIQKLGLQAIVVTGDSKPVSRMVREKFPNVVFQTGLLPEQKVQIIDSSRMTDCSTVMVGDGINDAPALAAADVGIAVGTGTDLARAAASVNIISHDLGKIPWLVLYARKVKHKIVQNLFWAFFYNVVAIALAAAGLLNPLIAATAMILSSLFVVWNSQQLKIHGD
ncbi:MAG: heavy metal translocating P-type ATPase, partial [bacterium]